jgi:hypothetical protein
MQSPGLHRHPTVFVQNLGRDHLLSRFDADQLHILNPVAYQIWLYCDGRHTPADIVAQLVQRFPNTPAEHIAADVQKTLAEFTAKGLLQPIELHV